MCKPFLYFFIVTLFISGSAYAQVNKKPVAKKPVTAVKVTDPWKLLQSKEKLVEIKTDYGTMVAKLYDSTPLHRDNFVKLAKAGFYDSLLFHRIIDQFMIQGGDPVSKNAPDYLQLGSGSALGERTPAEFRPYLFHKKGALAAARDGNPERASSNCQFYIINGKPYTEADLEQTFNTRVKPNNPNFIYTKTQKEFYQRIGGVPFLDQNYTVFGEVISGLEVIDIIAKLPKAPGDRPLQNVRMFIRLLN